ncbi:hypothetical protein EV356DRAFT_133039 [Viridothelium virens]|uniref:Uncharacterized protein n=1 Tax=Viridothelium virens TaxID=1048519 RepID=A0A6A6HBW6_VIRVR|nr:hypothetical protein EV356DRAFT_133039 [Viridothelium virens]
MLGSSPIRSNGRFRDCLILDETHSISKGNRDSSTMKILGSEREPGADRGTVPSHLARCARGVRRELQRSTASTLTRRTGNGTEMRQFSLRVQISLTGHATASAGQDVDGTRTERIQDCVVGRQGWVRPLLLEVAGPIVTVRALCLASSTLPNRVRRSVQAFPSKFSPPLPALPSPSPLR